MSQVDTWLSEGIGKLEMAQGMEENSKRAKRIGKVIEQVWEIIHDNTRSDDSSRGF